MSQTDKTDILDFNYGEFNLIMKEQLNSPGFNPVEFDGFGKQAKRLTCLNQIATSQMEILTGDSGTKRREGNDD